MSTGFKRLVDVRNTLLQLGIPYAKYAEWESGYVNRAVLTGNKDNAEEASSAYKQKEETR